jgi:hypothetical protein
MASKSLDSQQVPVQGEVSENTSEAMASEVSSKLRVALCTTSSADEGVKALVVNPPSSMPFWCGESEVAGANVLCDGYVKDRWCASFPFLIDSCDL